MTGRGSEALPYVNVIVPVFNDAERLARCLENLVHLNYPRNRYNVSVVDNGSTQDIRAVCRAVDGVRYLREDTPGSYAARNRGIAETTGEVLAFTDADCLPDRDWLSAGVRRLQQTPDCGLVGGRIDVFFSDPEHPTTVELYEQALAFPQQHFVEVDHWAATANMFTYRRVIQDVGAFDPNRRSGGDAEWGRRVHRAGYDLAYEPGAVIRHPSRTSFQNIRQKEVRVAGGLLRMIVHHDRSLRYFGYFVARLSYYTVRRAAATLAGCTVMAQDMSRYSFAERARIAWVLVYVHAVRSIELARLRLDQGREAAR